MKQHLLYLRTGLPIHFTNISLHFWVLSDKSAVYVMMDVPNPEFMQTFGLREDVKKAREEAGADVASTTVITPIKEYWLGD